MASPFLNQALDGTDIGYNKAIVDAQMAVAQGGDRRAFAYANPTGSYSYLGIARAAFPTSYLNTDPMPTLTGIVRNVTTDGNMATALAAAVPGDWLVVALATYTGIYAMPVRAGDALPGGNNVIVIISKDIYDSMIANGGVSLIVPRLKRATAADVAAHMPFFKAVSLANQEQIAFNGATAGWRFVGIRFGVDPTVGALSRIVRVGNGDGSIQTGPAVSPQNVLFDRCGFDGHATLNLKCALELHGRGLGATDCYFGDEIHHNGQDCQAIRSYNGPGPYRIVNNRLVASTENVIFGGAYSAPGCAPQNIEFRWNELLKPLTWNASHPTYAGTPWLVKNLFEVKKAFNLLVEGNYLHRSWPAAQAGAALLIKSESYGDGPVNGYTKDVIVRWNLIEDVGFGINIAGVPNVDGAVAPQRVWSVGNLYKVGAQYFDASQNPFIGVGLLNTCGSIHDTFVSIGIVNVICAPSGGNTNLTFLDTIFCRTTYGIKGPSVTAGTATLVAYAPGWDVRKCVFVGQPQATYPPNNYFPASEAAVGFTNFAGGDYSLDATTQVIVPPPPPVVDPPVSTVLELTIDPSAGTSGVRLATQPRLRLLDQFTQLRIVNGVVNVSVLTGTATVTAGGAITLTNGVAQATNLTLTAPVPGNVVLRFTEPVSGLYVDSPAIAIGAQQLTLTVAPGDGLSDTPLSPQPVLQLRDAANNPLAIAGVPVTVSVVSADGSITDGSTVNTDATGAAPFTALKVRRGTTGSVTLRFGAPGTTPVDDTVVITAPLQNPAVAELVCTRFAKAGRSGQPFKIEPRYEWHDVDGHVVTSETATVSLSVDGNVTLIGTTSLPSIGGICDFSGSGCGIIGRGKFRLIAEGTP